MNPATPTECDMCDLPATVTCTWGLYAFKGEPRSEPMQKLNLCSKHSDELWNLAKSAVNAGLMHWKNEKFEPENHEPK